MSTFQLLTSSTQIKTEDIPLADDDLLNPNESDCLENGEWITRDTNEKAVRATTATSKQAWQKWSQKGDLSAQVLGKVAVIKFGQYKAKTDMYKSDDSFAVGSELTVKTITYAGKSCSGLALAGSGETVHAICQGIPSANGGLLVYDRVSPYET